MASWTALISGIENYVKQNGNKAITGDGLQAILTSMVNDLGGDSQGVNYILAKLNDEIDDRTNGDTTLQGNINTVTTAVNTLAQFISNGYVFRGIATRSTLPYALNGNIFYLTATAGQYPNFGGITVSQGISIIFYNKSGDIGTWSSQLLIGIDSAPMSDSPNLVTSGGVKAEIIREIATALESYYNDGEIDAMLLPITTRLNAGYIYMGIATPSSTPNTSVGKVFYIAKDGGTYANYGNQSVKAGITILSYNGSSWSSDFLNVDGVFDISEYKTVGGTPAQYETLALAIGSNGVNIPADVRRGGMSIKYIDSTTVKYVQWRYMGTAITNAAITTISDWQGVDDEPKPLSNNTAKSGGISQRFEKLSYDNFQNGFNENCLWDFNNATAVLASNNLWHSNTRLFKLAGGDVQIKDIRNNTAASILFVYYKFENEVYKTVGNEVNVTSSTPPTSATHVAFSTFVNYGINADTAKYFKIYGVEDFVENATFIFTDILGVVKNLITTSEPFDISAYNESGGVAAEYASFDAAVTDLNVPSEYRRGGMIIRYIDSTINKYVQYRLMKKTWSTTESDWQGVDDEPKPLSNNTAKSGGISLRLEKLSYDNFQNGFKEKCVWDFNNATAVLASNNLWHSNTRLFKLAGGDVQIKDIRNNTAQQILFVYYKYEDLVYKTIGYDVNLTNSTPPSGATHVAFSTFASNSINADTAKYFKIFGIENFVENASLILNEITQEIENIRADEEQLESEIQLISTDSNKVIGVPLFAEGHVFNGTAPYLKNENVYVDNASFTLNPVPSGTVLKDPCLFNCDENKIYIDFPTSYYEPWGYYIDLYGNRLVLAESSTEYLCVHLNNSILMFYSITKDGTSKTDLKQGVTSLPYILKEKAAAVCISYDEDGNKVYFKTIGYDRKDYYNCFIELPEGFSKCFGIFGSNNLFRMFSSIEQITAPLSPFYGKKWGAIGDSETYEGTYYLRYYTLFEKFERSSHAVQAVGGAMLSNPQEIPYYAEQLDSSCDFVTVMGGINDYALATSNNIGSIADRPTQRTDINSVYGGVWWICKTLKERFNNKPICFILQMPEWNPTSGFQNLSDGYNTLTGKSIYDYWAVIEDVCQQWSIPVIKLGKEIGISFKNADDKANYSEEGLHPNNYGHFLEGIYLNCMMEKYLSSIK